jgi:hypothetical protein
MRQERSGVWFALWVLFAIKAMNFFDRQVLGAVGEPIRKEWGLSGSTLGALGTAVALYFFARYVLGASLGPYEVQTSRCVGIGPTKTALEFYAAGISGSLFGEEGNCLAQK